jgi:hypothetical protein
MLVHGNFRHRFAAAAVLGMVLSPGPWMASAQAGTLAQLQLQASAAKVRSALQPRIETCVGVTRSPSCRAAFETALRGTIPTNAPRGALYQSLLNNRSAPAEAGVSAQGHALAVKFYEDPEWQRRAKSLARDGIPFMRMPEGSNHELLVGITPRGTFGFALKDTTGQ